MRCFLCVLAVIALAMKTTTAAASLDGNGLIAPRYDACKDGPDCSACGPGFELCGGSYCFNPSKGQTCCQSTWVCEASQACVPDSGQCTPTVKSTTKIPTGHGASPTWGTLVTTITYTTSCTETTTITLISGSYEGASSYGETSTTGTSSLVEVTASPSVPGYGDSPPKTDTSSTMTPHTTSTSPTSVYNFSPPTLAVPPSDSTTPPNSPSTPTPIVYVPVQPTLPPTSLNSTTSVSPLPSTSISPYLNGTAASPTIYTPAAPPGIPTSGSDSVPVISSMPLLTSVAASTAPFPPSTTRSVAPTPSHALARAAGRGEVSNLVAIVALFVFWLGY